MNQGLISQRSFCILSGLSGVAGVFLLIVSFAINNGPPPDPSSAELVKFGQQHFATILWGARTPKDRCPGIPDRRSSYVWGFLPRNRQRDKEMGVGVYGPPTRTAAFQKRLASLFRTAVRECFISKRTANLIVVSFHAEASPAG
jgi:hypothetical protein